MNLVGLTKQEAIEVIREKPNWSKNEVATLVNSLKKVNTAGAVFTEIKVGDIIPSLQHPCLIFKVTNTHVYAVILTTESTCSGILGKCTSRFFRESYYTHTIISLIKEEAIKIAFSIYDNASEVRKIKSALKAYYKNIL